MNNDYNNQIVFLVTLGLSYEYAKKFVDSTLVMWIEYAQQNIDDSIDCTRVIDSLHKLKEIVDNK